MEYKGDEQPSLNNAGQPHSLEQMTVPASFLPSVLSRLGLGDMTSVSSTGVDKQLAPLEDEEISVRVAVVRSFEDHREANAIESLLAALHDPAWEIRAAAVWALGKFGEQASQEALMEATDDEDGSVRAAALRTLGLMGDRASIEPLIRALDDPDWQVREIATLTLGELGEQAPLEPLVARLNDEHARVREAARFALEQLHPEVLSSNSIDPILVTQEPGRETAFGVREQSETDLGFVVRAVKPSTGASILPRFSTFMRALQSKVRIDLTGSLVDTRSTITDDGVNGQAVSKPGELPPRPQPIQTKRRRLTHIAEGVLAALIIAGIVASWLVIQQRLHPSQGSTTVPLLAYHGHVDGPAVWSSDSKYVSILTDSTPTGESVLVWNKATGQVTKHILNTLLAQSQEHQVAFAPDGRHFAFVERDASNKEAVQVWDAVAWHSTLTAYAYSNSLNVQWSPDSTHIVIPGDDGTMQVWSVVTGHELVVCHVPPIDGLSGNSGILPDGHRIIYGYGQQNTNILDLTTCKLLTLPSTDSGPLAWSPQESSFATIPFTDDTMVQVWDAHIGRNLASFHLTASMSDILWTSDGTRIIASGDKEVDVLDVATQRVVLQVAIRYKNRPTTGLGLVS